MNEINQDLRQQTPLATRVSKACDRYCTSNNTRPVTSRQVGSTTETPVSRPTTAKRRRKGESTDDDERRLHPVHRLQSLESTDDHPTETGHFDNHLGNTRSDTGDDGEAESTMSMARKIYSLDQRQLDEFAVSAIPGAENGNPTLSAPSPVIEKYPTSAFLTHPLPPSEVIIDLLDEYFSSVH
ncbi:hypothetical protein M436DRAFT_67605 [Aureobasidium namibiae CBS 147.97]|uniref:Uncharacterized protein n=1 Tax=Aureobasidium namibiae CBS 147.97 TaxID=1043004 RepID=A0A074WBG1_9PEZI